MTTERTAGQAFTAEIRKMKSIGPRTRWYRTDSYGEPLTREVLMERIVTSINYPGYDDERRTAILRAAYSAICAWDKHVEGFRIDPTLRMNLTTISPWAWTAFLGEMVDSGLTNAGEFETWFRNQAREVVAA